MCDPTIVYFYESDQLKPESTSHSLEVSRDSDQLMTVFKPNSRQHYAVCVKFYNPDAVNDSDRHTDSAGS